MDLVDSEGRLDSVKAAQLLEANEQLVLRMLRAQVEAESAARELNEVARSAEHDPLTQLPNRVLLLDRFAQAIASAKRHGGRLAVLFLDLNDFKQINDTHGHAIGDQVLQLVAQRLTSSVRQADTVSRHGGDEFLILLTEVSQASDASLIADKLVAALKAPGRVGDRVFSLTASLGISIYPDDGADPDALIDRADAAMYRAKRQGLGSHVLHSHKSSDVPSLPQRLIQYELAIDEYESRHKRLQAANKELACEVVLAQEKQAASEQALRRQTELMVALAHDLCSPLAPASTAAELQRIGADQPLLGQVQDVLEKQVVEMANVIDEAVNASKSLLEARQQHLSVDIPAYPLSVFGDPIQLVQILCNLLENASKYTRMGGEIALSVAVADKSIEITVSDNGQGIEAHNLLTVFDPFVRGWSAADVDGSGLGLGLTLVRQFAQAHGGHVVGRSAGDGHGSEFIVTLPLVHALSDPQGG